MLQRRKLSQAVRRMCVCKVYVKFWCACTVCWHIMLFAFVCTCDDSHTCRENGSLFATKLYFARPQTSLIYDALIHGQPCRNRASWSCANGRPGSVNTFISCRLSRRHPAEWTKWKSKLFLLLPGWHVHQTLKMCLPRSPPLKHSQPNSALVTVCASECACLHVFRLSST